VTCERGLEDYMICTNCSIVFHNNNDDSHDVSVHFNLNKELAYACSKKCAEKIAMRSLIDHMKRKRHNDETKTASKG